MKLIVDRETNANFLEDKGIKTPLTDAQLLFSYRTKLGLLDKSKVDILYKDGTRLNEIEIEYLGEDKLDETYIERKLK